MTKAVRRSAKCMVVDDDGRVLLFRGIQPDDPTVPTWWFCPGGGLDGSETFAGAARRELREETGIEVADVGPPVHARTVRLTWAGRSFDQFEQYYVVRVGPVVDLSADGWTDEERRVIVEHRWWTVDELRHTDALVRPDGLVEVLEAALADD